MVFGSTRRRLSTSTRNHLRVTYIYKDISEEQDVQVFSATAVLGGRM